MIVEFFGLPGAGKSSIALALSAQLNREGIPCVLASHAVDNASPAARYLRKGLMSIGVLVRHPWASISLLGSLVRSRQRPSWHALNRWVDWLVAQSHMVGSDASRVIVLDQGSLQAVWSMGLRGDCSLPMATIARDRQSWRVPDLVFIVEASTRDVAARLTARRSRHSRLQDGSGRLDEELEHSKRVMTEVFHKTKEIWPIVTIRVRNPDGADPLEVGKDLALSLLQDLRG